MGLSLVFPPLARRQKEHARSELEKGRDGHGHVHIVQADLTGTENIPTGNEMRRWKVVRKGWADRSRVVLNRFIQSLRECNAKKSLNGLEDGSNLIRYRVNHRSVWESQILSLIRSRCPAFQNFSLRTLTWIVVAGP